MWALQEFCARNREKVTWQRSFDKDYAVPISDMFQIGTLTAHVANLKLVLNWHINGTRCQSQTCFKRVHFQNGTQNLYIWVVSQNQIVVSSFFRLLNQNISTKPKEWVFVMEFPSFSYVRIYRIKHVLMMIPTLSNSKYDTHFKGDLFIWKNKTF